PLNAQKIYRIPLSETLQFADFKTGQYTLATSFGKREKYTTLALVPTTTRKNPLDVHHLDLYLISDSESTLSLGEISGGSQWLLDVGNKQINVNLKASTINLQS